MGSDYGKKRRRRMIIRRRRFRVVSRVPERDGSHTEGAEDTELLILLASV
jgi:hypothetical protein